MVSDLVVFHQTHLTVTVFIVSMLLFGGGSDVAAAAAEGFVAIVLLCYDLLAVCCLALCCCVFVDVDCEGARVFHYTRSTLQLEFDVDGRCLHR